MAVGRFVVMPDHLHLFVRGGADFNLAQWVNGLKRAISVALGATKKRPLWQPGFFDHVLRNDESYSQKWEYVRENPVRRTGCTGRRMALSRRICVHRSGMTVCGRHGRLYTGIVTRNTVVLGARGSNSQSRNCAGTRKIPPGARSTPAQASLPLRQHTIANSPDAIWRG